MTTILLPIKPCYSQQILNGTKKVEYRKKLAKKAVDKILIYETSPTMKVVGEVDVVGILCYDPLTMWNETHYYGGIGKDDFFKYFSNCEDSYAYVLQHPVRYDSPESLRDYGINYVPQNYVYIS